MSKPVDCLIVGGGPAGLTAAIYIARFHLSVRLIDAGESRAGLIPRTMNHAGFPDGISGVELIERMRRQAQRYGVEIQHERVTALRQVPEGFAAAMESGELVSRAVLLATGVTNNRPVMDQEVHAEAMRTGRLRYCPVCDGYEVTGKSVGIIGSGSRALREATFLRSYSPSVTLIATSESDGLDDAQRKLLAGIGVKIVAGPAADFKLEKDGLSLACAAGRLVFETVYPALGSVVHSDLAKALGVRVTEEGCILVDAHQRTSVTGLYAAGDVVLGLDQIGHAMGEAGVAATTIRNDLAAITPLLR